MESIDVYAENIGFNCLDLIFKFSETPNLIFLVSLVN